MEGSVYALVTESGKLLSKEIIFHREKTPAVYTAYIFTFQINWNFPRLEPLVNGVLHCCLWEE